MTEFGREYRDPITGFVGKCTAQAHYIDGRTESLLEPAVGTDGSWRTGQWIATSRLVDTDPQHPPVGFGCPAVR